MPFIFYSEKGKANTEFQKYFNALYSSFSKTAKAQNGSYSCGVALTTGVMAFNFQQSKTAEPSKDLQFIVTVTAFVLICASFIINRVTGSMRKDKENEINDLVSEHLDLFESPPPKIRENKLLSWGIFSKTLGAKTTPPFSIPIPAIRAEEGAEEKGLIKHKAPDQASVDKARNLRRYFSGH